jgi:glucan phosphoethanolaminetransferase (alkaline phosphatase superfamily)
MVPILQTVLAGLIGTAVMTASLYAIHWRGFAEADMMRALGSIITRSESNSLPYGMLLHFLSGIVFAFLYVIVWSTLPLTELRHYVLLGLVTGFAHGLVVSFMLVILVAEHHPLPRFQNAGIGVALAHLGAHVVYGLIVGVVAGSFLLRLDLLPKLGS